MAAGSTMLLSLLIRVREEGANLLGKMRAELQEVAAANPQLARSSALVGQSMEATAISTRMMVSQLGLARQRGAELFQTLVHGSLGAAAAVYAFKKSFLDIAIDAEQMRNRLESVERTPGRAESAIAWLEEFRSKTAFTMDDASKAWIDLRERAINPLNGSFQAIADAAAAAGKPMGDIAREYGEIIEGHGVGPFRDLGIEITENAKKLGTLTIAYQQYGKTVTKTVVKNNRPAVEAAMNEAMEALHGGAAAKAAGGWTGMMQSMSEGWNKFATDVMEKGGVFKTLKEQLASFVGEGKKNAAGLTENEQLVADGLNFVILKLAEGALWLKAHWPEIQAAARKFVEYIGGWKVALLGVIGIIALPFIASLLGAVYTLGVMTLAIGTASLALMRLGVVAIGFLIRGLVAASAALLATPFGWLLLGAVAAGAAIWWLATHWDTATQWMMDQWEALKTAINWDLGMQELHDMVDKIAALFSWLGDHIGAPIVAAIAKIRADVEAVQGWLPSWAGGSVVATAATAVGSAAMVAAHANVPNVVSGLIHLVVTATGGATAKVVDTDTKGPLDFSLGPIMVAP